MEAELRIDLEAAYEQILVGSSSGVEMADMLYLMHPDHKHQEFRLLARLKYTENHPEPGIIGRMAKDCNGIAPQHPITKTLNEMYSDSRSTAA
jgi:hypothetical protein